MAQWEKVLADKPVVLSLIPSLHIVEGEKQLPFSCPVALKRVLHTQKSIDQSVNVEKSIRFFQSLVLAGRQRALRRSWNTNSLRNCHPITSPSLLYSLKDTCRVSHMVVRGLRTR